MPTATIRNVELLRTGTWNAGTGVEVISSEDLDAILLAAGDVEVDRAAIRIGHYDRRFDGEPALGWVANLRRVGDTLVGDLVDVPARLAEVIPKAFRRRSVELGRRVRTPSGKLYRAALSGLALLGVQPPAVKGLADVLALYETPQRAALSSGEGATVEEVAHVELVMGDVAGPELVAIRTTAAALSAAVEAGATTEEQANAILDHVYATAGVPDATITPTDGAARHNGADDPARPHGGPMPVDEARIRELLNIEQDADVEAELTNLIAQAQAGGEDGEGGSGEGSGSNEGGEGSGSEGGEGGNASGELVGAGAGAATPPGTVALSAGAYAELQAQAAQGAQALARIEADERATIIEQAQREGRISPAEATANFGAGGAWASLATRPPAELRTFLSGLAPRFSTVELGAGTTGELPPGADPALDSFLADTFGVSLGGQ